MASQRGRGSPNLIGGDPNNAVNSSTVGATIAGGGGLVGNRVTDDFGTVGGGGNKASGYGSAIGGGGGNQATADYATVPGGAFNNAGGIGSFAAGRGAWAAHEGSFVWGDGTAPAVSQGAHTFNALATGGFRFYFGSAGHHCDLTSTASWQCFNTSDREAKTEFAPVEGQEVLARVAALPIQTWVYKSERPSARHIGPMAQDFHAAFDVGNNEKEINTVDASGVALAAIQGLHRLIQEKEARIAALEARLTVLEQEAPVLATAAVTRW